MMRAKSTIFLIVAATFFVGCKNEQGTIAEEGENGVRNTTNAEKGTQKENFEKIFPRLKHINYWQLLQQGYSPGFYPDIEYEENPLMNVGVVGLQEPRISVTLYTSKTYLLSATQTPT